MSYNQAPTPPDPHQAYVDALEAGRLQIAQDLQNGVIQPQQGVSAENVAYSMFQRMLSSAEIQNAGAEGRGEITSDERKRRNQAIWEVSMGGLTTTPESIEHARKVVNGQYEAPGSQYSQLKKELDPSRPWYLFAGRGRVEVPRENETLVFCIGRIGAAKLVKYMGPTRFMSVKVLAKDPTRLLEIAERGDPTAQYLRPGERPHNLIQYFYRKGLRRSDSLKEFRYAEQNPNDPARPFIRLVGDTSTQNNQTRSRIEHRKAYIEARQRLLGHELRNNNGEHDWLANMHEAVGDYKRQLDKLESVYKKTHHADLGRFFRATDRLAAINALKDTTWTTAGNLIQTLEDYRDLIDADIEAMNDSLAGGRNPILDQTDRTIVLDIQDIMEDAFEDSGFDATWHGDQFDTAAVQKLLPSRSIPYGTERAELVRAALIRPVAEMAENLAGHGKSREAERMLRQFKKMGILHEYAYDAIKVMVDHAYIQHWQQIQNSRLQPGRAYAYFSGGPGTLPVRYTGKIPPQGDPDRKALSSRESDLAMQIILDGTIQNQLALAIPYAGTDGLLRIASSLHDGRTAAAFKDFFTPPRPKKSSIGQRIRSRLNRSRNSPPIIPQP